MLIARFSIGETTTRCAQLRFLSMTNFALSTTAPCAGSRRITLYKALRSSRRSPSPAEKQNAAPFKDRARPFHRLLRAAGGQIG